MTPDEFACYSHKWKDGLRNLKQRESSIEGDSTFPTANGAAAMRGDDPSRAWFFRSGGPTRRGSVFMTQAKATTEIRILADADELAEAAASRIERAAAAAIAERGLFTLALAGGSTPEKTYKLLAQPERRARIDWARIRLYFGDERFVPHDDPRSNYGMAQRSLIGPASLAPATVFPIPTDLPTAAACAAAYEATLRKEFAPRGQAWPVIDLVLLGLGDDGHTASLFPGKPALRETNAWVTSSPPGVLPPPVDRITMTFPVLNAAREVLFLVAGAGKASPIRDVLKEAAAVEDRPAVGVRPTEGALVWLLDKAAAAGLA